MKPLLQQLENESLLLLYMAGELPEKDREELESMLARDSGLRAQLEALSTAEATAFSGLAQLDAAEPLRPIEPTIRQVNRAIQQWQIDRLARPAAPVAGRSFMRVWAWSAGSVVAACLIFCIWWGFRADNGPMAITTQPANTSTQGEQLASRQTPNADVPANSPNNLSDGSADNSADNSNVQADAIQIVTMDANTQRLGELEAVVSEDLTRD